jgi:hypothetical protein
VDLTSSFECFCAEGTTQFEKKKLDRETLYGINPATFGGCRGVYLPPYLESVGFKKIQREFISQLTFPFEVICGIKP